MLLGKCKDIAHLLSDALDRPLTKMERIHVRMHLPTCSGCRYFCQQISFLRAAVHVASGNDRAVLR
ncbi:zf-HC2 domain-containing protein [Burkholderia pyrrocinia]|uniref:zf-HC2 domain-containing protein n=1 Tax=Burkholderia pyrrocinia TaxID=60550 RepID=UPI00104C397E|nr:zf-HC2 domain-containing protein [Burkholderia pyrrocinia]TDA47879.1 zf-HC2 domain-containing protein [Burkholderia pyrrocinia]